MLVSMAMSHFNEMASIRNNALNAVQTAVFFRLISPKKRNYSYNTMEYADAQHIL